MSMNKGAHNQSREETSRTVSEELELLAVMGQDFAASLDIEETLSRGLQRITDYVGAQAGAVFVLSDDGTTLTCTACSGPIDVVGLSLGSDEGIVGRCVQNNIPEIVRDVSKDPNFFQAADEVTGFETRSLLCAPLSVKDQKIGAIELVNKSSGDGLFDETDLHLLQSLSSSAALAIINARMAEALVEQERVRRELELAAEIQRSLLPDPGGDDFPVCGINFPARTVSGDFYDFFPLEDGRICFNLGDVSGKGMNAALLMAKTASLFRCLGKTIHQPGQLMARINAEICETVTRGMFVTMVGGVFDPRTGKVVLANAGHEPPLFRRTDGSYEPVPAQAPPIGISPFLTGSNDFPETEIQLENGSLYIFTDGVTEGYLENGEELGAEGLQERLTEYTGLPIGERLQTVLSPLKRDDVALRDDLTLLVIEDNNTGHAEQVVPPAGEETVPKKILSLQFRSQAKNLKGVRSAITGAAMMSGCSEAACQDVVIAVDEACQNVIRHAYNGDDNGAVELDVLRDGDDLVVELRDYAAPVDVSKIKPRELDDVRPGGLGTHFIREVMDTVEFLRPADGEGNLLRMVKRIA